MKAVGSDPDAAFWSTGDVAKFLGVPEASVRYWAWQGNGPPSFKIGRRRKYKPCEVEEWAEDQREEPVKAGPVKRGGPAPRRTRTTKSSAKKSSPRSRTAKK